MKINNNNFKPILLAGCVALASGSAFADVKVYEDEKVGTFSVDASFNTFFSQTSTENDISGIDRDQSRVRSGFLPNWVGFNFSKELDNVKIGGRSSFWVSINDSNRNLTETGIDVRQFYATLDWDWGQVLIGKDFTLFSRSNIFLDEILLGYGNVNDTLGLVDGTGVSFGNIGSGYIYPLPTSQITYRTPTKGGFRLALGIVDPGNTTDDRGPNRTSEENTPRFEGELTYEGKFSGGKINAFAGFLQQSTESDLQEDVDTFGISYGAKLTLGGFSIHASGFDGEAVGFLLGPGGDAGLGLTNLLAENGEEVDSDGYLAQVAFKHGKNRYVASYGETDVEIDLGWENEGTQFAWFHAYNSNVTFVAEYSINEITLGSASEEAQTLALGAIVNF
ncbi:porin [Sessilibacter sp. MAH2]